MTDRALLQQALEALELLSRLPTDNALDYADNAITALRERLEQCDRCGKKLGGPDHIHTCSPQVREPDIYPDEAFEMGLERIAYYAAPLTDEQEDLNLSCKSVQARLASSWGYVKAQPEQEPFAYSYLGIRANGEQHGPHLTWKPEYMDAMSASMGAVAVPLYTTPPQRKPLTDEEIEILWQNTSPYYDQQDFARAIEAKLKEKNNG